MISYIKRFEIIKGWAWARKLLKESDKTIVYLLYDFLQLNRKKAVTWQEYYQFELENQSEDFRSSFLGVHEQREYLDYLNPKKYHSLGRNKYFTHVFLERLNIPKAELYCYYNPELFIDKHNEIGFNKTSVFRILKEKNVSQCVIKTTESSHGENVWVIKSIDYLEDDCLLLRYDNKALRLSELLGNDPLIFESHIQQTKQFMAFNESSVNTIRFMTALLPNGKAMIIGSFIKIGRQGSCVDNAGSGGNVNAAIDLNYGSLQNVIQFDGWRKITQTRTHPDSKITLDGIVIKDWISIKEKIIAYQQSLPFIKVAGWDIAITNDGPKVIEVNDFWDRAGQIFLKKGWREEVKLCYLQWKETNARYPLGRLKRELSNRRIKKIIAREYKKTCLNNLPVNSSQNIL